MNDQTTNQVATPSKHFSLNEMSRVLMDRERPPVGFFVSKELWCSLEDRWRQEGNGVLGLAPVTFHGIKIVIDPSMPETEFDVAFNEAAWSKRLREIETASPPT